MNRRWPSQRPTVWTCCAPPASTTSSYSCCTKTPAKSMLCYRPTTVLSSTSTDEYGVAHRVWQISDPAVIRSVQEKMRTQKLVIADGHHRYETALNFRNECRAASGKSEGNAPYEFVMMTFVNMNDPGLLILPTHRVVHSLDSFSVDEFQRASCRVL